MDCVRVIVVDDNPADARLVAKLLDRCEGPPTTEVRVFDDAVAALASLRGEPSLVGEEIAHLVLLDQNLPRMTGVEFLREARSDPALAALPIVVLSSSVAPGDVDSAYAEGANAYLRKPVDLDQTRALVDLIHGFWSQTCRLPELSA